jgi:hypothetical protein
MQTSRHRGWSVWLSDSRPESGIVLVSRGQSGELLVHYGVRTDIAGPWPAMSAMVFGDLHVSTLL